MRLVINKNDIEAAKCFAVKGEVFCVLFSDEDQTQAIADGYQVYKLEKLPMMFAQKMGPQRALFLWGRKEPLVAKGAFATVKVSL